MVRSDVGMETKPISNDSFLLYHHEANYIMATLKEVDHTAVDGSEEQLPTQEEAVWEQTPERRHVDVLLDISEEDFMKELEPHKYHCYSGWEEAVHGWARVSPLSCILLTQKGDKKSKPADNPTALPADPTLPDATGMAEHRCESRVGLQNNLKKSIPLTQHTGSVAALQKDGVERPVLNSMQKTTSKPLLREKLEKEGTRLQPHHLPSRHSANRATQTQKHRCTVVPIQNITFLPPIVSPSLNRQRVGGQLCSGKKAQEGETTEENHFIFDAKSRTGGSGVDHIANPELPTYSAVLTSKYWTCLHNPHLFSAVSVSIPERYHVPVSSKPDTVHRTSYSAARSLTQGLLSSTASGAHLYPSKTVCL